MPRRYCGRVAKSSKPRDIPAGASVIATNRRARRDYDVLETLEVGIVLRGSEVKSLREGSVQLASCWARADRGELWLHNLHIAPYAHASAAVCADPDRVRKLLAHRSEIRRLAARADRERLALIPLSLYFLRGRAKLALALARGRSKADRRQEIIRREADSEAARSIAAGRRRSGAEQRR